MNRGMGVLLLQKKRENTISRRIVSALSNVLLRFTFAPWTYAMQTEPRDQDWCKQSGVSRLCLNPCVWVKAIFLHILQMSTPIQISFPCCPATSSEQPKALTDH
jgi:hypothetical protein